MGNDEYVVFERYHGADLVRGKPREGEVVVSYRSEMVDGDNKHWGLLESIAGGSPVALDGPGFGSERDARHAAVRKALDYHNQHFAGTPVTSATEVPPTLRQIYGS